MFDPREFWIDPDASDQAPEVREICRPQFYLGLHNVTDLVVSTMLKHVGKYESILELGCGTGRNLAGLYRAGYNKLYGIEINKRAVDEGKIVFPELKHIPVMYSAIEDEINNWYGLDCLFTQGVLMHLAPASEWIFQQMVIIAKRHIITIENETDGSDRAWARNYKDIFTGFGWSEVESHTCEAWPPLPAETVCRVFVP